MFVRRQLGQAVAVQGNMNLPREKVFRVLRITQVLRQCDARAARKSAQKQ